ncbi:hypothetical protein FQN54_007842 [Arachnomyces sp. PD_36]|nr:hypothetical protein FQN54_007842 [Arachnomyces sp. PD_36]
MKALILIDLQNEFLDPARGRFSLPEPSTKPLLENIKRVVPSFRSENGDNLVIWVRAEYSNANPSIDDADAGDGDEQQHDHDHFIHGKHSGKTPCCGPGSYGAELYPDILELVDEERDVILTKSWFSTFKETGLADLLVSKGVEDVYFAGLLSNVCILASVSASVGLRRWRTHVVKDCLGYRREKSHATALAKIAELGSSIVESSALESDSHLPKLYYVNGSIPSWRVLIALNEKNIATKMIRMKVMSTPKPTRQPDFLAINPRGKTPVFIDNDSEKTRVYESLAILHYIEQYYPHRQQLMPSLDDRATRAKVLCIIQESENLHTAYDALEDAYFDAKREKTFDTFATHTRPALIDAIHAELGFWEEHLRSAHAEGKKFIAGTEGVTLADCAFFPLVAYMVHRGLVFGGRWPEVERYYGEVGGVGSVQRARPEGWAERGKTDVFQGK